MLCPLPDDFFSGSKWGGLYPKKPRQPLMGLAGSLRLEEGKAVWSSLLSSWSGILQDTKPWRLMFLCCFAVPTKAHSNSNALSPCLPLHIGSESEPRHHAGVDGRGSLSILSVASSSAVSTPSFLWKWRTLENVESSEKEIL